MKKQITILLALLLILSLTATAFAAETVRPMIDSLPTVEEFAAMNKGDQNEAYNRTQQAYDAYMALSQEERAKLPGAEETFEALFTYFNGQIMTIREADANSGKRSVNSAGWLMVIVMAIVLLGPEIRKKTK